jgi:hypothetical protein
MSPAERLVQGGLKAFALLTCEDTRSTLPEPPRDAEGLFCGNTDLGYASCARAMTKVRIVILRFGTARQNMVLE